MSKKISQLQKVMHHLNNKTDDDESVASDLVKVSDHYELEIDEILQDAAGKIAAFQRAIRERAEASQTKAAVDALRAEHDAQRAAMTREFEDYRRRAEKREAAGDAQVAALTRDVDAAKTSFETRPKLFGS